MTNHYSPKTFLRQTSNDLLRQCFADKGALSDLPWDNQWVRQTATWALEQLRS
jgi:hypothetical protein